MLCAVEIAEIIACHRCSPLLAPMQPLDTTRSYQVSLDPTRSHWIPTESHQIPPESFAGSHQSPTRSHQILPDPTRIPPDPTGSHQIPPESFLRRLQGDDAAPLGRASVLLMGPPGMALKFILRVRLSWGLEQPKTRPLLTASPPLLSLSRLHSNRRPDRCSLPRLPS